MFLKTNKWLAQRLLKNSGEGRAEQTRGSTELWWNKSFVYSWAILCPQPAHCCYLPPAVTTSWQGPSRGQSSCQLSVFLSEKICWIEARERTKASTEMAPIISQHSPRQEPHSIPSSAPHYVLWCCCHCKLQGQKQISCCIGISFSNSLAGFSKTSGIFLLIWGLW